METLKNCVWNEVVHDILHSTITYRIDLRFTWKHSLIRYDNVYGNLLKSMIASCFGLPFTWRHLKIMYGMKKYMITYCTPYDNIAYWPTVYTGTLIIIV